MTTLEEIWFYKKKDYKEYNFDRNLDINDLRLKLIKLFKNKNNLDIEQSFIYNDSNFVVKNNLIDVYKLLGVKYRLKTIWNMKKSSLDWILWYYNKDVEKDLLKIKVKIFKLFKILKILEEPFIKDYYIIKKLGEGSFGVVYECINYNLDHVVIKEVKIKEKSHIEIENMDALKNNCDDYFSCMIDHFEKNKKLYIIMEYLDGYFTLSDLLETDKKLLKKIFKKIVINLFKGIKLMHSLDVSHNDIKPDNIMVNKNGDIKYIDFGGACYKENCVRAHCYTFKYTDPSTMFYDEESEKYKKIKNEKNGLEIAKQADLWSLGIVIYDLIIGKTPMSLLKVEEFEDKKEKEDIKRKIYVETYDFQKDPNKEKINKFLKKIDLKINIEDLLTKSEKKYFY